MSSSAWLTTENFLSLSFISRQIRDPLIPRTGGCSSLRGHKNHGHDPREEQVKAEAGQYCCRVCCRCCPRYHPTHGKKPMNAYPLLHSLTLTHLSELIHIHSRSWIVSLFSPFACIVKIENGVELTHNCILRWSIE